MSGENIVPNAGDPPKPAPVVVPSPYAAYGLDADGNPIVPKPVVEDPRDAKIAALEGKLGKAEKALEGVTGLTEKMAIIDRVIKAVSGEGASTDAEQYKNIFADLKKISPPGVRAALELLERDPSALDRMAGQVGNLEVTNLVNVNMAAHSRVLDLAKKAGITKGANAAESAKMVFPFERAITEVINTDPKLRAAFVSGNVEVIDEVFNNLVSPYVAQRVRDKAARAARSTSVVTPPGGRATPNATSDDAGAPKRDLSTPKGRAAFHKAAVNRFMDKAMGSDE